MRNLVVCCDGTWNSPDQTDDGVPSPTNVARLATALEEFEAAGGPVKPRYIAGVGTSGGPLQKVIEGAVGRGLDKDVAEGYRFLAENYSGDSDRIYLLGFSRGAYTARSIAGLIQHAGLMDLRGSPLSAKERDRAVKRLLESYETSKQARRGIQPGVGQPAQPPAGYSKPEIRFVGVWDTVGALGIPADRPVLKRFLEDPKRFAFGDTELGSLVQTARQALAIDEKRIDFTPTLWDDAPGRDIKQVWFAGVHGNIGGSYKDRGLSDIAFQWMLDQAQEAELGLPGGHLPDFSPNPDGVLEDSNIGVFKAIRTTRPRSMPRVSGGNPAVAPEVFARGEYRNTREVEPGSSVTVQISSEERWNWTGVYMEPGQHYHLQAQGQWKDASLLAGPDGIFPGPKWKRLAHLAAKLPEALRRRKRRKAGTDIPDNFLSRRFEDAPWFALIGVIADGKGVVRDEQYPVPHSSFVIGQGRDVRAEKPGYLFAYANDAWVAYGNNSGSLELTITRLG